MNLSRALMRDWNIYRLARRTRSIRGEVGEVGVYRGRSAKVIALARPDKKIHLFDTFAGMPPEGECDNYHKQGDFADTSLALVVKRIPSARFHIGLFQETVRDLPETSWAFVHVDCDLYSSTKAAIDYFLPRMAVGGIMLFDDYSAPTTLGARKAVDESGLQPSVLLSGQAIWEEK